MNQTLDEIAHVPTTSSPDRGKPPQLTGACRHKATAYLFFARLAIAAVVLWNLQCALAFLFWPERFMGGLELSGTTGEAALRSLVVLFFMWNIPYGGALWRPSRYRVPLYEATAMQATGLLGETLIWTGLPAAHSQQQSSHARTPDNPAILRGGVIDILDGYLFPGVSRSHGSA